MSVNEKIEEKIKDKIKQKIEQGKTYLGQGFMSGRTGLKMAIGLIL